MRKFIIDTDTGSDDAVALMMALLSKEVEILGITTVCGNVPMEQGTLNALMTVEVCGREAPVYKGADRPLFRELVTAVKVHGDDGMGDSDLIHPRRQAETQHAVDYILETVRAHPGEVEIVALGPATNLALAILRDRETMKQVKRVISMGTGGFGLGNTTPVAEFNVYVDAESYAVLLESGIPVVIAGFDLCVGEAALNREEIEYMLSQNSVCQFAINCNKTLLEYNLQRSGNYAIDLPDAVAMAVALWDNVILEQVDTYCYCCTKEEAAYGQVIVHDPMAVYAIACDLPPNNATVVKTIDIRMYKDRMIQLLNSL